MKPEPLDPGEFAALHWIAARIGRLSEARIAAARLVIQDGKTYKYAADLHQVSPQAVWNTVSRMNELLAVYRHAKALEARGIQASARAETKRPATKKPASRKGTPGKSS
jgi:predicted DNA-binding protein (UPF0251 family)